MKKKSLIFALVAVASIALSLFFMFRETRDRYDLGDFEEQDQDPEQPDQDQEPEPEQQPEPEIKVVRRPKPKPAEDNVTRAEEIPASENVKPEPVKNGSDETGG